MLWCYKAVLVPPLRRQQVYKVSMEFISWVASHSLLYGEDHLIIIIIPTFYPTPRITYRDPHNGYTKILSIYICPERKPFHIYNIAVIFILIVKHLYKVIYLIWSCTRCDRIPWHFAFPENKSRSDYPLSNPIVILS